MIRLFFAIDKSYWLLVFPILYRTLPWLQYRIRSLIPFAFLCFWVLVNYSKPCRFRDIHLKRSFLAAFGWQLVFIFSQNIHWLFGHGDLLEYHILTAGLLSIIYLIVCYFSIIHGMFRELKFVAFLTLAGYLLGGVMASRGLAVEGFNSARVLMHEIDINNTKALEIGNMAIDIGAGQYHYVYECAMLVAPIAIAFFIFRNPRIRVFLALVLGALFVSIKLGGLGTPVVIALLSLVGASIWFVFRKRTVVKVFGWIIVLLLTLYTYVPSVFSPLAYPVGAIGDAFGETSDIGWRFKSIADSCRGDKDSYAYNRYERQRRSIKRFFESPLWGVGAYASDSNQLVAIGKPIGGHSFLFDRMATQGILGTLPLFFHLYFLLVFFRRVSYLYLGYRWLVMPLVFYGILFFTMISNPIGAMPYYLYYLFIGLAMIISDFRNYRRLDVSRRPPMDGAVGQQILGGFR